MTLTVETQQQETNKIYTKRGKQMLEQPDGSTIEVDVKLWTFTREQKEQIVSEHQYRLAEMQKMLDEEQKDLDEINRLEK